MEKMETLEILESSVNLEVENEIKEKVLKWIYYRDEGNVYAEDKGKLRLNMDYNMILRNKKCNALKCLNKIEGWENVTDLDYYAGNYKSSSEESEEYVKTLMEVDEDNYKSMYFIMKSSPTYYSYFGIIGKKNNNGYYVM